jgi:CDP-glucose 4,6-dehydratase
LLVLTGDGVYRPAAAARRESDPLGAMTPHAASLGCAELMVQTYRHCYLTGEDGIGLASLRPCMLVGGGDFAAGRPVPAIVRSIGAAWPRNLRDGSACPPFLHVLDALRATLQLAQALARRPQHLARAWNLAPPPSDAWPLSRIAERLLAQLGGAGPGAGWPHPAAASEPRFPEPTTSLSEPAKHAAANRLEGRALADALSWRPLLTPEMALDWTAEGYRRLEAGADAGFIGEQIARFAALSKDGEDEARGASAGATGHRRIPLSMPMLQRKPSHVATLA